MRRRAFLEWSLRVSDVAAAARSWGEGALLAHSKARAGEPPPLPAASKAFPTGKIGPLRISRLICGGNLISGFAHSRDLIYVSPLVRHYFTDEKVFETLARC